MGKVKMGLKKDRNGMGLKISRMIESALYTPQFSNNRPRVKIYRNGREATGKMRR